MGTLKKTLLFFFILRVLAIPGYFLLQEYYAPLDFISQFWQHNYLLWSWANFDGEHYLSIAKFGYGWRGGMPQFAFFPLLPLLIKIVNFIVRDYMLAGSLVIFASVYTIIALFPRWLKLINQPIKSPITAFFLSSGVVFLGSIYSEPVFLALTLGVFVLTEKKRYFPASLLAGLATATRISGVFTALFLIYRIWQSKLSTLRKLIFSGLSFLGILANSVYMYVITGDFLGWYHAQGAWGKSTATSPLTTLTNYFKALTFEFKPDFVHLVVFIEVMVTAWAIYLFVKVLKNQLLSSAYLIYLAGNVFLPIITGSLGSMPRFMLTLFPSFVAFNTFSPKMKRISYLVSGVIMFIGISLFTRGHWYA